MEFRALVTRPRVALAVACVAIVFGVSVLVSTTGGNDPEPTSPTTAPQAHTVPQPTTPAVPREPLAPLAPTGLLDPEPEVSVDIDGFLSWAVLDRTTGQSLTSDNAQETSSTESMIKTWIVADYLRRLATDDEQPHEQDLRDARRAIRDSHNGTTERLYVAGGRDRVVERMIDICELSDTHTPEGDEGWWSRTEISAQDAVRLGECLIDGRAAGPQWTGWLLDEMRQVRGSTAAKDQRTEEGFEGGRWGIINGLPDEVADQVAIKNGWTRIGRTNSWHVSCLAVTDDWVMAVLMRYPAERSLDYGAQRCASVARQLVGNRLPAEQVTGLT